MGAFYQIYRPKYGQNLGILGEIWAFWALHMGTLGKIWAFWAKSGHFGQMLGNYIGHYMVNMCAIYLNLSFFPNECDR